MCDNTPLMYYFFTYSLVHFIVALKTIISRVTKKDFATNTNLISILLYTLQEISNIRMTVNLIHHD
jgi:hypothetical protein